MKGLYRFDMCRILWEMECDKKLSAELIISLLIKVNMFFDNRGDQYKSSIMECAKLSKKAYTLCINYIKKQLTLGYEMEEVSEIYSCSDDELKDFIQELNENIFDDSIRNVFEHLKTHGYRLTNKQRNEINENVIDDVMEWFGNTIEQLRFNMEE